MHYYDMVSLEIISAGLQKVSGAMVLGGAAEEAMEQLTKLSNIIDFSKLEFKDSDPDTGPTKDTEPTTRPIDFGAQTTSVEKDP